MNETDKLIQNFRHNLRSWIQDSDWTQRELAEDAGVHHIHLAKLLQTDPKKLQHSPQFSTVLKLAIATGMPLQALLLPPKKFAKQLQA